MISVDKLHIMDLGSVLTILFDGFFSCRGLKSSNFFFVVALLFILFVGFGFQFVCFTTHDNGF